jgi:short-subunit dehydrogenase
VTAALVTGASGGIGLEIARVLAGEHDLVLVARSADRLQEASTELGGATVLALDLAEPDAVARIVAAVPEVDVLVNNAGLGDFSLFAGADPAKLDTLIALNIGALTQLTRAYLPGMLARKRGRILNVASTAAFQPGPLMAVYYATKAYVLSLSEALAEETRGSGVTVTALCPGPTASGFQAGAAMEGSRLVRGRTLPTAASVAEYGVAAMRKGDAVAVPGLMNKMFASSVRLTPRPIVRRIVHRMQSAPD